MTRPTSGRPAGRPAAHPAGRPAHRSTRGPAALVAALLLGLVLAPVLAGCSGADGGREPGADPSLGSGEPTTSSLRTLDTTLRTGVVTGRLPREVRRRTVRAVGRVVDGWIDAAYLGGDYPRRDFGDAFAGFTRGARPQARSDRRLLSNEAIGARIDGVRPVRRVVLVDVLAAHGHAKGATARVRLAFRTTGRVERRVVVRARLALTRSSGWRVFAYDATKGSVA